MVLTLLEQLPVSVLVMIVFAVLVSEVACRRIIRLVNAIARLTNKDIRAVRHKGKEKL